MKNDDYTTASALVRRGGVIAYPTEAVWGFGCDPWNKGAVHRILRLKQRPVEKGLIIVAADVSQIRPLIKPLSANLQTRLQSQLDAQTAQATTWLIPDIDHWLPGFVKGTHDTIAVRVSQHPVVKALCQQVGKPIISTSANLAGEPALTQYTEVVSRFAEKLDMIVQGETGGASSPSTIVDLVTGTVIR